MLYQSSFRKGLSNDIILVISKYLKCKTENCSKIADENILFKSWNFQNGRYCKDCIKVNEKELEHEEWFWRDDHGIRL